MLTLTELARRLSQEFNRTVSLQTVSNWVHNGVAGIKLPSRSLGGSHCVDWNDYLRWQEKVDSVRRHRNAMRGKRRRSLVA